MSRLPHRPAVPAPGTAQLPAALLLVPAMRREVQRPRALVTCPLVRLAVVVSPALVGEDQMAEVGGDGSSVSVLADALSNVAAALRATAEGRQHRPVTEW